MKIAVGSDHAGFNHKTEIINYLNSLGYTTIDIGTDNTESSDYPDFGQKGAILVSCGKADFAVLICGTGIGMSIAANKIKGIRAAVCWNEETARLARQHNNANVLCLGARVLTLHESLHILKTFLNTKFLEDEEKHKRRVKKISDIEERGKICE